jgi:hypothetical protein
MSCTFGYSGETEKKDFYNIKPYSDIQIESIVDPEGGLVTEMPTAIPSPFARFDQIKTAFKNITLAKNDLKRSTAGMQITATTNDEKLVSHTLDLAEIIFNRFNYIDDLEILKWNKNGKDNQLDKLKNGISGNKRFAKSLELYLDQDKEANNFDLTDNICLFKYKYLKVIGSTSPVTLFCPSADRLADLGIKRTDQSVAFGEDFKPLYERGDDFQKWFYFLLQVYKSKGYNVREKYTRLFHLFEYAKANKAILKMRPDKQKILDIINKIEQIDNTDVETEFKKEYEPLNTKKSSSDLVSVLGFEIHVKPLIIGGGFEGSDFIIKSSKYQVKNPNELFLPLVLQPGFSRDGFVYADGNYFKPGTEVPFEAEGTWKTSRKMPGLSIMGRYITVSDFLEPYLIKAIYPISDNFLKGVSKNKESYYLLPLKKDFFEFFNVDDLKHSGTGNPKISIEPMTDGNVKVMLKVPVKKVNEYIILEKVYKSGTNEDIPKKNILDGGIILERRFGVTIFPFVKIKDVNINYKVQLVDSDKALAESEYELNFYAESDIEKNLRTEPKQRMKKQRTDDESSSKYYQINNKFDIIQFNMSNPNVSALIAPYWPDFSQGTDKYTFAVDFGTTNTYVAYKKNDEPPKPFDITGQGKDIQIATLFEPGPTTTEKIAGASAYDIVDLIDHEFIPREIGKSSALFAFPQRTAIAYSSFMSPTDWNNGLIPLMNANIPFGYEKMMLVGNNIDTNIKWNTSSDPAEQAKTNAEVKVYLEELVMLMQNKVLANGGNLDRTSLIWFYPSSMTRGHIGILEDEWEKHFSKYFFNVKEGEVSSKIKENKSLTKVTESLAPYYAQIDGNIAANRGVVVSIDIGGGTTDVAVFSEGKLKGTTSFKFAGNVLFGDGYSKQNANKNGFVLKFAEEYQELLKSYRVPRDILVKLMAKQQAADINAFFFSIENSIASWAEGKSIDPSLFSFSNKLRLEYRLKFLILYFYVALIYHVAQILKNITEDGNTLDLRLIMFSGTGSKIMKTLGKDELLTDLTTEIFNNEKFGLHTDYLEIKLVPEPKEATCNGGLKAPLDTVEKDMRDSKNTPKYVYTCIKGKELDSLPYYDYLNKNNIEAIKENLTEFHEFFFNLNKKISFADNFLIEKDVTEYVQREYSKLLGKFIDSSIIANQKIEEIKDSDPVAETPFFMPLKAIILELSEKIAKSKKL